MQFDVGSPISSENPRKWAFKVLRTPGAVGFTEYRENVGVIQAGKLAAGFEVTDSGLTVYLSQIRSDARLQRR
jgi:hypothetical protein